MTTFGSSPNLTVIYNNDKAVLKTVLDLAERFDLVTTNLETPEEGIPTLLLSAITPYIILKSAEEDEISGEVVEGLRNGVEELHGFNRTILHASARGGNSVAVMEIAP
jgi:hypothetical protein